MAGKCRNYQLMKKFKRGSEMSTIAKTGHSRIVKGS